MSPITCKVESSKTHPDIPAVYRLRFVLPFNTELLVYDDYTTLHAMKLEFDAMPDPEQRAFLNAFIAEKLSL